MQINQSQEAPCRPIKQTSFLPLAGNNWTASRVLSVLGIVFCVVGLVMACNPTDVEAMQSFRQSFHKMLGAPSRPYNFSQAAVVLYMLSGAAMIALSFRKPTAARSISCFFGAMMFGIVLVKCLFGRFDSFILFQLLVCVALVYYGFRMPKSTRS